MEKVVLLLCLEEIQTSATNTLINEPDPVATEPSTLITELQI